LWDVRQPRLPTAYATIHNSDILSFDWSKSNPDEFATSDQDCTIKFFDTVGGEISGAKYTLKTAVPVWKARYTPFGPGLATVIVPHLSHDVDNSLFIWDCTGGTGCLDYPVHCFFGHRDVILDFDWRECGGTAYQLVRLNE
jgi:WD40 repeat protein